MATPRSGGASREPPQYVHLGHNGHRHYRDPHAEGPGQKFVLYRQGSNKTTVILATCSVMRPLYDMSTTAASMSWNEGFAFRVTTRGAYLQLLQRRGTR